MFYNQTTDDVAIMNMENKDVMDLLKGIKSQTKYFSSKNEINGVYLKDNLYTIMVMKLLILI